MPRRGRELCRAARVAALLLASHCDGDVTDRPTPIESRNDGGTGGSDDCQSDADCPGSRCAQVVPGFSICVTLPSEATSCLSSDGADECCTSADCAVGRCYEVWAYPSSPVNSCLSDQCTSNTDCGVGWICLDAGVVGRPVRSCVQAFCRSAWDCQEGTSGRCVPIENNCTGDVYLLACRYEGQCRRTGDCGGFSEPPYEPGETFCDGAGECEEVLEGSLCN